MERGPMALFGAIIAVGLGPALWLGAQIGAVNLAPNERPSSVGEQFPDNDTGVELDFGGAGAGQIPEQADPVTRYDLNPATSRPMRPDADMVGSRPSAQPSSSAPATAGPSPSVSGTPSAEPSEPSTPPTESTETADAPEPSESSEPPAGGTGGGEEPVEPGPERPES